MDENEEYLIDPRVVGRMTFKASMYTLSFDRHVARERKYHQLARYAEQNVSWLCAP